MNQFVKLRSNYFEFIRGTENGDVSDSKDQIDDLPKNEAGLLTGKDLFDALTINTKKNSPELQNFQKYLSDIGWYISAYNDDDTINIKNQAGTKTIEVSNGQPLGNLIKSLLLLEGVSRREANKIYSDMEISFIGAGFVPLTSKDMEESEKIPDSEFFTKEQMEKKVNNEFNSNK